ncbi:MAG: Smr/MutS family protein [Candidatus Korobacteraceae bacterium]
MTPQNKTRFKAVNLEDGMPAVPAAMARLEDALRAARREKCVALKIIHGYGSSGVGGTLRQRLQAELAQRVAGGEIRAFIAGEDWRVSNQDAWNLVNACPELRKDADLGRGNRGISIVVL